MHEYVYTQFYKIYFYTELQKYFFPQNENLKSENNKLKMEIKKLSQENSSLKSESEKILSITQQQLEPCALTSILQDLSGLEEMPAEPAVLHFSQQQKRALLLYLYLASTLMILRLVDYLHDMLPYYRTF